MATVARASLVALLAGCATSQAPTVSSVPSTLKALETQRLWLETRATGAQIYQCSAMRDDPTRFEWVFKAAEAELFDTAGRKIGKHYAGPTWESNDGSTVVGEVKARDSQALVGKEMRVPYKATYYFYGPKP